MEQKICVYVRLRQQHDDKPPCVHTHDSLPNTIAVPTTQANYSFDHVGDPNASQTDVFEKAVKPIAEATLAGFNGTILTYGQTGAGKTYTMCGPPPHAPHGDARGMVPRVMELLFGAMEAQTSDSDDGGDELRWHCTASFAEIYNEVLTDLLAKPAAGEPPAPPLRLREDPDRGIYVAGLKRVPITTTEEAMQLLTGGLATRQTGGTAMNDSSSRSHAVFSIQLNQLRRCKKAAAASTRASLLVKTRMSQLHLVDLAGSERQRDTGAVGVRLKEACNINGSLMTLAKVISALVKKESSNSRAVIPYRESKLTYLLRDSLGGNSKTCIIANVATSSRSAAETISTLKFALCARSVATRAAKARSRQLSISHADPMLSKVVGPKAAPHDAVQDGGGGVEAAVAGGGAPEPPAAWSPEPGTAVRRLVSNAIASVLRSAAERAGAVREAAARESCFKRELATAAEARRGAERERDAARANAQALQARLAEAEAERDALRSEATRAREKYDEEAAQAEKARSQHGSVQAQLEEMGSLLAQREQQLAEAEGCNSRESARCAESEARCARLEERLRLDKPAIASAISRLESERDGASALAQARLGELSRVHAQLVQSILSKILVLAALEDSLRRLGRGGEADVTARESRRLECELRQRRCDAARAGVPIDAEHATPGRGAAPQEEVPHATASAQAVHGDAADEAPTADPPHPVAAAATPGEDATNISPALARARRARGRVLSPLAPNSPNSARGPRHAWKTPPSLAESTADAKTVEPAVQATRPPPKQGSRMSQMELDLVRRVCELGRDGLTVARINEALCAEQLHSSLDSPWEVSSRSERAVVRILIQHGVAVKVGVDATESKLSAYAADYEARLARASEQVRCPDVECAQPAAEEPRVAGERTTAPY